MEMLATRLCFCLLCIGSCAASSSFEALSGAPIVSGLSQKLSGAFPGEPQLAVERAVADGLERAMADEGLDLQDVTCNRDYSRLCPEGWAEAGDGSSCIAQQDFQGSCPLKLDFGGLTPLGKRQQALRCGAHYPCHGACSADTSKACPLGWTEDVNHDCLAPVGYGGRCVGRKNFKGMKKSQKAFWAHICDVAWPCRKPGSDAATKASESIGVKTFTSKDCVPNYSEACPDKFEVKGSRCVAASGFSGMCGFSLSSQYNAAEKAAYAAACLTPWPCMPPQ